VRRWLKQNPRCPLPLHPDIQLMAQHRRTLVPRHHGEGDPQSVFHSAQSLQVAIDLYIANHNNGSQALYMDGNSREDH
jgi:hypothetical protein